MFYLTGGTTDAGAPVTFGQGANSLPSFVNDLINGSGRFSALGERGFQATLRYGSVNDALAFNVSQQGSGQWVAQLTSPFQPGLINRQFVAATRSDLDSQIDTYLRKDGTGDLARFLAAISKRTVAGALDGNPNAATAETAQGNFFAYGLQPTQTAEERDAGATTAKTGLSMSADAGFFKSLGVTGQTYSWTPTIPLALGGSERVRLDISLPLNYTMLDQAAEYRVGGELAVAVTVVKRTADQPWVWQLTPSGGALVDFSEAMVAGGVLANGGLTSLAGYRAGAWEFSMGNHFSLHEGVPVTVADYNIDPRVSQQIIKNGFKVGRSIGRRWYAEVYAVDSEFVEAAFLSRYTTLGAGVGYRRGNGKGYIMLGGYTDFGANYNSGHLQFGTGWKF